MSKLAQQCKQHIVSEIGYAEWFGRFVTLGPINDRGECRFACIAHEDGSPSASLNVETGLWKCFVPSCNAAGDAIEFYQIFHGIENPADAIRKLAIELGLIADIPDELVEELHQRLFQDEKALQIATQMFGLKLETLRRFKIGLDVRPGDVRFTIPIRGADGDWVDLRRYNNEKKPKIKSWDKGCGGCRIFPREFARPGGASVLFEGEKDALRAYELGIHFAVTGTGGAGQLPDDYREMFRESTVYICYDIDEAGIKGAKQIANRLATCAASVRIVHLPPYGLPETGDFSDWVNAGGTKEAFLQLLQTSEKIDIEPIREKWRDSPTHKPQEGHSEPPGEPEAAPVAFRDLNQPGLFGRRVRFLAHTVGASVGMPEYQAPLQIGVDCRQDNTRYCSRCRISQEEKDAAPWPFEVDLQQEQAMQLIRCTSGQMNAAMKRFLGIPERCYQVTLAELGRQAIQQLLLSPPTEYSQMRSGGDSRRMAFFTGDPVQDNLDYWFEGYVQADPKTRETIIVIDKAEPAKSELDSFETDERVHSAIAYFTPDENHMIADHFLKLHRVIEADIGVYGRYEVQQAFLETVYSPLKLQVGNRRIDNGWIEYLIIGDTRTGKSTCIQRMMEMINIGEYISCENATVAGLIGGVQYQDKFGLPTWGAWPRNNGGFLVLDEIDELSKKGRKENIIEQLSSVRSNGIAEIQKIVSARTPARVRSIWITNPVHGREVSTFNGGCRAIDGIFQSLQDIARFTKAVVVSNEDVAIERITQSPPIIENAEVRDHFNRLAMLVWSLQADQVEFTEEAQNYLRAETKRLTEKYHASLPLIEKGSCLDKVAKLTCPIAALCGSFRVQEHRPVLVCDLSHAIYAVHQLELTYDHINMGYDRYSEMEYKRNLIGNEEEVRSAFYGDNGIAVIPDLRPIFDWFLVQTHLKRFPFLELIGCHIAGNRIWSVLIRNNCIIQDGRREEYKKTPAFVKLLDRIRADYDPTIKAGRHDLKRLYRE